MDNNSGDVITVAKQWLEKQSLNVPAAQPTSAKKCVGQTGKSQQRNNVR